MSFDEAASPRGPIEASFAGRRGERYWGQSHPKVPAVRSA